MSTTTFSGPIISENGFQGTIGATTAAAATVTDLTTTGTVTIDGATVIISDLPTADPTVAGQLWSNSGVLTVSAG